MSREQKEESLKEEKLAVFGLKKMFGRKTAVAGIDFSMRKGEIVGFLGQNGAGKTTAFYMIAGFIKPTEGKIMLGDKEISKLPMYKRAQMGISYLPQEASIFRKLTVEENIAAIIETRSDLNRKEKKALLEELIEEFGIGHIRKQKAFTLSGGERRRTEIARALSMK
ncbi:MAG: ATP-binding cassette domain-containing protein, partial [Spirochaetia bacterium]|nr:ATP-binding cassette domain-containing protein [Spirochaetia bacterium]